ncbi:MAG: Tad domain-containing protein, partial [Pirellulales bacterium]
MRNRPTTSRHGVVLVLLLVAVITLFAFVALAIDLGMLAVVRTQLQDAVDVSAMAGTRTLNGDTSINNNYSSAAPNAITAATNNTMLSKPIQAGQVNVQIGRYVYLSGPQRFEGQIPGPSTENWSMVTSQITADVTNNLAFARVFNFGTTNMQATATAVHRPRDVSVIMDYSGSMRFASLAGIDDDSSPHTGSRALSNNPDGVFPQFGHYSAVATAALQATSFTYPYDAANITVTTSDGRPPIVNDFYSDAGGTLAFAAASSGYATAPGGDNFLKINKNSGGSYCTTPADLLGIGAVGTSTRDATFESAGYTAYGMAASYAGYTQGPGYWGKSFFVWPPDPRAAYDWRVKYFGTNDNSRLWVAGTSGTAGDWRAPSGTTYAINYAQILNFIKNVGPNQFPSRLQSGRILYYDAIPDTISSSNPPSDLNQRFWKDYINYVLGLVQSPSGSWYVLNNGTNGYGGYGPDYTWGALRITAASSLTGTPKPYMHYLDNPKRPRTHF